MCAALPLLLLAAASFALGVKRGEAQWLCALPERARSLSRELNAITNLGTGECFRRLIDGATRLVRIGASLRERVRTLRVARAAADSAPIGAGTTRVTFLRLCPPLDKVPPLVEKSVDVTVGRASRKRKEITTQR